MVEDLSRKTAGLLFFLKKGCPQELVLFVTPLLFGLMVGGLGGSLWLHIGW